MDYKETIIFSFLFNIILSVFLLLLDYKRNFNAYKIFYIFSIFFFGVSPLIFFQNNTSFFSGRKLLDDEYFFLNIIISCILILYRIIYFFLKKKVKVVNYIIVKRDPGVFFISFVVLILFFLWLIFINGFSLQNFFYRLDNNPIVIIKYHFLQKIIAATIVDFSLTFFIYIAFIWKNTKITSLKIITLISLFAIAFPTHLTRVQLAFTYLPIIIILVPSLFKSNRFSIALIISLLYFFPFFNQFRMPNSWKNISFKIDPSFFNTAHFDSYYNFALIYNDIQITYGKQILGVILFFVPRVFWQNKPIGSGAYMAEIEGMSFRNISANYFAEGYVNFGYLGILLFLVILCYISAKADKNVTSLNNPFTILYIQNLFILFYILRGDLMSSFPIFVSILISNYILLKLFFSIKKNNL